MDLRELEGENIVVAGKQRIPGFISRERCPSCFGPVVYHGDYDAQFCPACNAWLERTCPESQPCEYCRNRPERPLSDQ